MINIQREGGKEDVGERERKKLLEVIYRVQSPV